jgi:1,4-dihydroxy-2-naphthoate octaprenyltransferase
MNWLWIRLGIGFVLIALGFTFGSSVLIALGFTNGSGWVLVIIGVCFVLGLQHTVGLARAILGGLFQGIRSALPYIFK